MNNWFGEFPSTWKFERLENYIYEINEKNNPIKTDNILSLTNKLGVVPYSEKGNQGNTAKESLDEYKIAYPNTIVCNCMNVLIGSVGISNYYGCVSPVYYVFKAKGNAKLEFINYIFQTTEFQKELRRYANGILEIRLRVSSSNILKRRVPIPTLEEQNKIVEVIKSKEEKINALIKNEESQIEKLKAYKQVLISEVVTKGLDPNVPMKDSGIEWIGRIPENWMVKRTKYLVNLIYKGSNITKEMLSAEGNIECVRYGDIYSKYDFSFKNPNTRTFIEKVSSPVQCKKYDVLCAGTGELVDEIGKNIIYLGDEPCLVGSDIICLRSKINGLFFNYALNSNYSQKQKSYGKSKLTVVHIYPSEIQNIYLAVPPENEQIRISTFIDSFIIKINSLIELRNLKIQKLKLYRQSMIYEYVTGKREVN